MLWLMLAACGPTVPVNPCEQDDTVLVQGADPGATLTCAEARIPTRYGRLLAGRPLPAGSTAIGIGIVKDRFLADPAATERWLAEIASRGAALEEATGLAAAEARAADAWRHLAGRGPIRESDGELWNLVTRAMSVRARDDAQELALTEADIEGWVNYASLAHEARGAGVLTVSIAARADLYALASQRFAEGDRDEKVALAAFGPIWEDVRAAWRAASAEAQQAWIAEAPLPDPIGRSSLAYLEAVLEGDVRAHAATLHRHLGPFHVKDGDGWFAGAPR